MQVSRVRRGAQQLPVQADGALVLAQADAGAGVERAVVQVIRIERKQFFDFLAGPRIQMPLEQYAGVVVACRAVVWRDLQHSLKQ
jgi:hypothetical protein